MKNEYIPKDTNNILTREGYLVVYWGIDVLNIKHKLKRD
jgi:hypothetical protein